jgi:hypothetical protein
VRADTRLCRQGGPARQRERGGGGGRALGEPDGPKGWEGEVAGLLYLFFFYSEFPNSFFLLFSLLDSNSNMPQIQIQIIQTCA